jgi:hypothetical protein
MPTLKGQEMEDNFKMVYPNLFGLGDISKRVYQMLGAQNVKQGVRMVGLK